MELPRGWPADMTAERFARNTNYRLTDPLGAGAEGVVFRAHKMSEPAQLVAIKLPHLDGRSTENLLEEAEKARLMMHPHIVAILGLHNYKHTLHVPRWGIGVRQHTYLPYIVSEYMAGGTLQDKVLQEPPMPSIHIASIFGQLLSAVAYAHGEDRSASDPGLIHRDIKPPNILFSDQPLVQPMPGFPEVPNTPWGKISDFGIAVAAPGRIIDGQEVTITEEQMVKGTFPCMPFEQFSRAVPQSDDFALAATMYWLITGGQYPITIKENPKWSPATRFAEWYRAHETAHPIPYTDLRLPHMDRLLEELQEPIMRSLAKKPKNRYATTGAFLEAVRLATQKGWHELRRNPTYIDIFKLKEQPAEENEALDEGAQEEQARLEEEREYKVSRRIAIGALGMALSGYAISLLWAESQDSQTEKAETRAEKEIVVDIAKQVLQTMERQGLTVKTPLILKHLLPYDPKFVAEKITALQEANHPEAPWLAVALAQYLPSDAKDIGLRYKELGNIPAMAYVAASLNAIVESSPPIATESADPIYRPAFDFVLDATNTCREDNQHLLQYVIQAATKNGQFKPSGFPPFVSLDAVLVELYQARQYEGALALGLALAPYRQSFTRRIIKDFNNMVDTQKSEDTELILEIIARLITAIAPYDKRDNNENITPFEIARMSNRSEGLAAELSWRLAFELAPYEPNAVLAYINRSGGQNFGPRVAAIALASSRPDDVKKLLVTTHNTVRQWAEASLNLRDGHSPAEVARQLINNKKLLNDWGAEFVAALLASRVLYADTE